MRAPSWDGERSLLLTVAVLCGLLLHATTAHAQIWVVTDKDGRQRFTSQPEPGARLYLHTRHGPMSGTDHTVPFAASIAAAASTHAVDPALVEAVIRVESNFDPHAVSSDGAQGLMQLMPQTAADLGVRDVWDPDQNVAAGTAHLARLLQKFDSLELALAAYNAGEGTVERHGGIPPYPETQQYVQKVMGYYEARHKP